MKLLFFESKKTLKFLEKLKFDNYENLKYKFKFNKP